MTKTGTWNDDGDGFAEVGETISYAFTVTNNGNVTLTNITLSDPGITLSGDPIATLAVGVSDNTTFTGSYTLTQGDIDLGVKDNTATVTGTPPIGADVTDTASDSVNLPQNPAILVIKTSTTTDVTVVNQVVPYSFAVSNNGNVTLTGITVTDANCDAAPAYQSGDANTDNVLDLNEIWTYTCSRTITQAEIDTGGNLSNTVTADLTESLADTDTLDIPITQTPSIQVVKSSSTTDVTAAGQIVPYSFAVTNTGNITLSGISVTDPDCDATPAYQSGDTDTDSKLDLSETWTYTCSYTVTQTEMDAGGNLSNTVTADFN